MAQGAYIFGYGSLIEKKSRTRTNPEAENAQPARITGYQRGWFHQFAKNIGSTCTFLGAIEKPAATVNGVIYHVDDFDKTKARETGYTPKLVPAGKIEMLDGSGPWDPAKQVYIFISNPADISKTKEPTKAVPMVQSYVDICIAGCLEVEAQYPSHPPARDFAGEFIRTSTGWNANWVNDRIYPRRPFIYVPNAAQIDGALHKGGVLKYVQLRDLG